MLLRPNMAKAPEKIETSEIAATVIKAMRKLGISPLPRNYELVYEFLNASSPALVRQFSSLGNQPSQAQLDTIGKVFVPHHHGIFVAETVNRKMSSELKQLVSMFQREQSVLSSYANLLGETSARISANGEKSAKTLAQLATLISSVTGATKNSGDKNFQHLLASTEEIDRIRSELEEYRRISNVDPITKLANRRAFDERLAGVFQQKSDIGSTALLIADIDFFKSFNDTYGHPVGDRVLGLVSTLMNDLLPEKAFIARVGGEEFAIIINDTDVAAAQRFAEHARAQIASTPLKNQNSGTDYGNITMSFGLCMANNADDAADLYSKADMALYSSKNSGRNRIEAYRPEIETDMKREEAIRQT